MRVFRRGRKEKGAVLVELAFALPIFLLVVWCVVEFARLYYTSNSLSTAVREGARFAAVFDVPCNNSAAIKQKVIDAFNPFGGPAITTGQITLYDSSGIAPPNCRLGDKGSVTIEVKYRWDADNTSLPLLKMFPGDTIGFKRKSTFRWERQGT